MYHAIAIVFTSVAIVGCELLHYTGLCPLSLLSCCLLLSLSLVHSRSQRSAWRGHTNNDLTAWRNTATQLTLPVPTSTHLFGTSPRWPFVRGPWGLGLVINTDCCVTEALDNAWQHPTKRGHQQTTLSVWQKVAGGGNRHNMAQLGRWSPALCPRHILACTSDHPADGEGTWGESQTPTGKLALLLGRWHALLHDEFVINSI